MYCSKCGSEIDDDATFCPYCGTSTGAAILPEYYVPPVETGGYSSAKQTNGCAIAGFLLAFTVPYIGFILSIIGIVKSKRECRGSGRGLAITGLIISLILMIVVCGVIALGVYLYLEQYELLEEILYGTAQSFMI